MIALLKLCGCLLGSHDCRLGGRWVRVGLVMVEVGTCRKCGKVVRL